MVRVGVISCTCQKIPLKRGKKVEAQDLYMQSHYFRLCRAFVEAACDEWVILSAKFGVLWPENLVQTYNKACTDMKAPARRRWAQGMVEQLLEAYDPEETVFCVLAGKCYRQYVFNADRPFCYELPFEGTRGIGDQKHLLAEWLEELGVEQYPRPE